MAETYKAARDRLLVDLALQGWKVTAGLKVPHATAPDGGFRFWFKPQAVWFSSGNSHTLGGARSIHEDIRGMSLEKLISVGVWYAAHPIT